MSREDFEKWASPEFDLTIGRIRVGRYMLADTRAAWAGWQAALQHRGEVTVTKNAEGQIVCVSRNDADGRILSVIAEATPQPVVVPDALSFDEALSSEAITYRKGWNACRTVMLLAGIKDEATPQPVVDVTGMDEEDAMFTQIETKARATYRRHTFSAKGQIITRADDYESHLVWAAIDWAKANTTPQPVVPEGYALITKAKLKYLNDHHHATETAIGVARLKLAENKPDEAIKWLDKCCAKLDDYGKALLSAGKETTNE
jgi:hypothetical protein